VSYLEPPDIDKELGMMCYLTNDFSGGYLRRRLSDFLVDEVLDGITASSAMRNGFDGKGGYFLYVIAKTMPVDFLRLKSVVSSLLGIRVDKIGFAGMKDKRSISFQFATSEVRGRSFCKGDGITIRLVGKYDKFLAPGIGSGNKFIIGIRETCPEKAVNLAKLASRGFLNFYGYQRFGYKRPFNHEIGRMILQRRFKDALEALAERGFKVTPESDYIRSLRLVGVGILRILVQSYQSFLFNKLLSKRALDKLNPMEGDLVLGRDGWVRRYDGRQEGTLLIPVPGAYTKVKNPYMDKLLKEMLKEDNISLDDFLIKEIPECSSLGSLRPGISIAKDLKVFVFGKTVFMSFFLNSGSYATVFVREIVKPRDPEMCGF